MPDADTRDKRASSIGIDLGWMRVYPNPDGTIDANDRQQSGYKYYGFTAATATGGAVSNYRNLMGVGV